MDELNIEFHHARSRRILGEVLSQEQLLDDLHCHAITVLQALRDDMTNTIVAAQVLPAGQTRDYMIYGVGRRLNILIYSLQTLIEIVHPAREEPLTSDEGRAITRDLNVVYINLVGVIDNLAWAAFHQRAPNAIDLLGVPQIGLFTQALARTPELQPLAQSLEEYRAWFRDMRGRRDPSAHRMPLYLPPAILGPEQAAEHVRLGELGNEAIGRRDWGSWDEIMDQQQNLGRMSPVFLHSPAGPLYRFYPTVPEDVGQMIKVVRAVTDFLSEIQ